MRCRTRNRFAWHRNHFRRKFEPAVIVKTETETETETEKDPSLCGRIESSITRVAKVRNFQCVWEVDRYILRGDVVSRQEAMMCGVVARLIPGVGPVVNQIKVTS